MITLTVPPRGEALAVLRATIGAVAARARLTLDQVDDVRMAVEEAALLLLPAELPVTLSVDHRRQPLTVTVSVPGPCESAAESDSLPWVVLQAVTDVVEVTHEPDATEVMLSFAPVGASR